MPILSQDEVLTNLTPGDISDKPDLSAESQPAPSTGDVIGAALNRSNTIGSFFGNDLPDAQITDPNFNPIEQIKNTPYIQYANKFIYADNENEVQKVKDQIDKEHYDISVLSRSGAVGTLAMIGAGIVDPITYIPFIGQESKVIQALKIAKTLKSSEIATDALKTSGLFGASSALTEAGLHTSQTTRTGEESAYNILASTVIGGILGTGTGLVVNKMIENKAIPELVSDILQHGDPKPMDLPPRSAGAAESTVAAPELKPIEKAIFKYASIPGLRSPVVEGLTSESATLRQLTNDLFEHNFAYRGGDVAPSMESILKGDRSVLADLDSSFKNSYKIYTARPEVDPVTGASVPKKTINDFANEVGTAMRLGDKSDIPEVQLAAQSFRKVIDSLTKRMQELEILPKDLEVKFASSYLTRVYDSYKIIRNRSSFLFDVSTWWQTRGKSLEEAQALADNLYDEVIGLGDSAINLSDISRLSVDKGIKFTKDRINPVPDEVLMPWLENRANVVVSQYVAQAQKLIRFNEMLQKRGYQNINDIKQSIKTEYQQKRTLDPENSVKYDRLAAKDINHADAFVKVMLGQYAVRTAADRALRYLRTYNYLTKMGSVVISSLPDLAMPVFKHGLWRTIKGWEGIISNYSAIKADLKHLGVATDLEMNSILKSIIDPDFNQGIPRGLEETVGAVTSVFDRLNTMKYWNGLGKRLAGYIAESRIIEHSSKFGTLDQAAKDYLKEVGVSENIVEEIAARARRYGGPSNGGYISGVEKWPQDSITDTFKAAVNREVDSTIITPGKGDTPLAIQRSELGRTLLQFKGFFAAATNRVFLAGLQKHDFNTLMGMVGLLSMGMVSYAISRTIAEKDINTDPTNLIMEGFNRSGVLGLIGDPIFALVITPSSNGRTRYMDQNPVEYLAGPSSSIVKDMYSLFTKTRDGKLDEKSKKKAVHLLPYQNLFWLRVLFNKLDH